MSDVDIQRQPLAPDVTDEEITREIALRTEAGAVKCYVEGEGEHRQLVTEWPRVGG